MFLLTGASPLHTAAQAGNRQKVSDWMAYGGLNPYIEKRFNRIGGSYVMYENVLHFAVDGGHMGIITDLVEKYGVHVNVCNDYKHNILHMAIKKREEAFARTVMTRYAGRLDKQPTAELHAAPPQIIDINAQNSFGATALHHALTSGLSDAFIHQLLQLGADIGLANHTGRLPIHLAAERGRVTLVKAMLRIDPQQAHAQDPKGYTPLHYAINGWFHKRPLRRFKIIKLLIDTYGVDPGSRHNLGRTLYKMWYNGGDNKENEPVNSYLLKQLGLPKPAKGKHPFLDALYQADYERVLPNAHYCKGIVYPGWQPVHYAAAMFPHAMAPLQQYYGADLNARTQQEGYSVLHCAAWYGNQNAIEDLLAIHKIDPNLRDKEGRTALHITLQQSYDWIDLFAKHQADLHAVTNYGWNVLHFAAMWLARCTLTWLIKKHGIDPHQTTKAGDTALHIAAQYGQIETVRLLMHEFDLDPKARNNAQKTPGDLAQEAGYPNVLRILKGTQHIHLIDQAAKLPPKPPGVNDPPAVIKEINDTMGEDWFLSCVWDLLYDDPDDGPVPSKVIEILVKHVTRPYPRFIQEGMVRVLATPEAKGMACPALVTLYHQVPHADFNMRWLIGHTVSQICTKTDIPRLLDIVKDSKNGASREMFIAALRHLQAKAAIPILQPLTKDDGHPLIRIEAIRTLKCLEALSGSH